MQKVANKVLIIINFIASANALYVAGTLNKADGLFIAVIHLSLIKLLIEKEHKEDI